MRSGIPMVPVKAIDRLLLLSFTASVLLISCFSGQPEKKGTDDRTSGKSGNLTAERLSRMVITNNATYSALLEEMDRDELVNIDQAITLFVNNKADSLSRDSMLVTFNELMNDVMQSYYATKLTGNQKMIELFENGGDQTEAKKTTSTLAAHGIQLSYRLGDFYLEPDLDFISARLSAVLTTSSRAYLETSLRLSKGFIDAKNQPLSTPDSLAIQVSTWEEFLVSNPDYVLKEVILAQYTDVLAAYLSGVEQSPLFDATTKNLDSAYQNSYLRYIEKYPDRESGKTVKKFYELLAAKGFKYDESLDTFLSEVNFNPIPNGQ